MCPRFWELGHGGAKVPEGVIWQDIGGTKGGPRDSRVTSATGTVLKAWPQAIPHLHTLSIVSITYTNYTQGYCISISVSIKYSQHHSALTVNLSLKDLNYSGSVY